MNVALVYDRINKFGGAERILLALHELWPEAPLFTAVYNKDTAKWSEGMDIRPSFMQHMPLARTHHEFFPWLTPFAFESFSFDAYDCVISVTSAEAKSIITKPHTLHICYNLTPTRYLWSGYDAYQQNPGLGAVNTIASFVFDKTVKRLRAWDSVASARPDRYVAISRIVANRIMRYYDRTAECVIYPPINTDVFTPDGPKKSGGYYLTVARLVGYKRIDVVIDAFNKLGLPLVIIGDGKQKKELRSRAASNITIVRPDISDAELASYYRGCRAFVFAGQEDLGLVAAEAQACGVPVVAYRNSGISEIITDRKTGILFDKQTPEAMIASIAELAKLRYDREASKRNTNTFRLQSFRRQFKSYVETAYREHKQTMI